MNGALVESLPGGGGVQKFRWDTGGLASINPGDMPCGDTLLYVNIGARGVSPTTSGVGRAAQAVCPQQWGAQCVRGRNQILPLCL